jgi:hypothetical protein
MSNRQNVEWDKTPKRHNVESNKGRMGHNVKWDKMSNDKMSNGTKKCRRIVDNVEYRLCVIVSMFVTVVCCCC